MRNWDPKWISEEIEKLASLDSNFRLPGAETHRYRFNPPASEDIIFDFESKYRIQLPQDFRSFLTKLGNGGAGPFLMQRNGTFQQTLATLLNFLNQKMKRKPGGTKSMLSCSIPNW